jgi:hypothetical protein
MGRMEVQKHLRGMHLGLISLHHGLDQPGYPSKVFDYVAANLPIIYFGRHLPAFCETLTTTGIGEVLNSENADLEAIYFKLISKWEHSRKAFLSCTDLNINRILACA